MSDEIHPSWYVGPTFHLLNHGEPNQYLGFLIGIDLSLDVMLSSLLLSIKHKLLY